MNLEMLDEYLYTETESEHWHLAHPGLLSPVYKKLPKKIFNDKEYYYFDFHNTLKAELLAIVKETRYTTIPPHFHKDMELNYIYSGKCSFLVNEQEVIMEQGDLCILDTNVIHSSTSVKQKNDIVINMVFRKDFFDYAFLGKLSDKGVMTNFLINVLRKDRAHNQFLIFHTKDNFRIHRLIQFLATEYFGPSECYHELMLTYSAALFTELINTSYTSYKTDRDNENLLPILKYIETNYLNCSLAVTASHFGYNANYLSNCLKRNTGKSFTEIKIARQMAEAASLLSFSNLTITDIAERVGCTNLTYFYIKFSRIYNMSPREYRELNKTK